MDIKNVEEFVEMIEETALTVQVEDLTVELKNLRERYEVLENEHLKLSTRYEGLKGYTESQRDEGKRLVDALKTVLLMVNDSNPIYKYIKNILQRKDGKL